MIDKDGKLVWDNDVIPSTDFPQLMEMDVLENELILPNMRKPLNDLEEVFNSAEIIKIIYPRIYERIEATWGSTELDLYFNRLIIDDRGNREGFPKEVLNALLILAKANRKEFAEIKEEKIYGSYLIINNKKIN